MAYQANRNQDNSNVSTDNQPQTKQQAQSREGTKNLAKQAGSAAMKAAGVPGPIANLAANKVANNPLVNKTLNKVGDQVGKNPLAAQAMKQIGNSPLPKQNSTGGNASSSSKQGENQEQKSSNLSKGSKANSSLGTKSSLSKGDDTKKEEASEEGVSTFQAIGNAVGFLKKIPPFLWPVIGYILLILLIVVFIVSILSQFFPMFGTDSNLASGQGGAMPNYVAGSEEEQAMYDRIKVVEKEYKDRGVPYQAGYIASTFTIMNHYDNTFSYDDMTDTEIRKISEMMFRNSTVTVICKNEEETQSITGANDGREPSCPDGYTKESISIKYIYNEATFKEEMNSYVKSKLSLDSDDDAVKIADEIFQLVKNYQELITGKDSNSKTYKTSESYWWPIGSKETTTENGKIFARGDPEANAITATFAGNDSVHNGAHGAIDITNYSGQVGVTNIIAAKDGVVIYPTSESVVQFADNGYFGNTDGGGLGNYVIIQHSDGIYTYYGHMAKGSITVKAGEQVTQGQVIGKMGNSGSSTGTHVHFAMKIDGVAIDPEQYVSQENPRPNGSSNVPFNNSSYTKEEFVARVKAYYTQDNVCSSSNSSYETRCNSFKNDILTYVEDLYTIGTSQNINPELFVARSLLEGYSPGTGYNYFGYTCYNTSSGSCTTFTSFKVAANTFFSNASQYTSLEGMMSRYAYLGDYWYNPGSSSVGGCYYKNYVYPDGVPSRVEDACSKSKEGSCDVGSTNTCVATNDEDKAGYTAFQVRRMEEVIEMIFG